MGCLKLTYYEREETLEKSLLFIEKGLEKNGRAQKKCVTGYRYGFNGQEKDDEWKGDGNSIAYEARIYDPRLGRFLSVDPWTSKYAWQTPYAYHKNSPIAFVDWKGYGDPTDGEKKEIKKGAKKAFNQAAKKQGESVFLKHLPKEEGAWSSETDIDEPVYGTNADIEPTNQVEVQIDVETPEAVWYDFMGGARIFEFEGDFDGGSSDWTFSYTAGEDASYNKVTTFNFEGVQGNPNGSMWDDNDQKVYMMSFGGKSDNGGTRAVLVVYTRIRWSIIML
jgi:RHS repeat-associated protein